jgi:hypothetical protein
MSGYNQEGTIKGGTGAVREGNWQEELVLKQTTGCRFYPSPQDRTNSLLTTVRCISHTDQMLPKDYKSTLQTDIQDPTKHKDYALMVRKDIGPRKMRMDQAIRAQVESEFAEKNAAAYTQSRQVDYTTTMGRSLERPGFIPFLDDYKGKRTAFET